MAKAQNYGTKTVDENTFVRCPALRRVCQKGFGADEQSLSQRAVDPTDFRVGSRPAVRAPHETFRYPIQKPALGKPAERQSAESGFRGHNIYLTPAP